MAVVVVRGEVKRHAQLFGQGLYAGVVPQQVVVVHQAHTQGAQQVHQVVKLGVHVEFELEAFAVAQQLQCGTATRYRGNHQKVGFAVQGVGQLFHVAQGAAGAVVRDGQHFGLGALGEPRQVKCMAVGLGGVGLNEAHDLGFVVGVEAAQGFHGGQFAGAFAVAKTDATGVQHKGVECVQVAPAGGMGAAAEVVFFAVAFAEVGHVKQAHQAQAVAPDVHAKTHASGHVHGHAGVGGGAQGVQAGRGVPGHQWVGLAKAGVAANGGVV